MQKYDKKSNKRKIDEDKLKEATGGATAIEYGLIAAMVALAALKLTKSP